MLDTWGVFSPHPSKFFRSAIIKGSFLLPRLSPRIQSEDAAAYRLALDLAVGSEQESKAVSLPQEANEVSLPG